jgi:hypothetical protein
MSAREGDFRLRERVLEDIDNLVAGDQADEHSDADGRNAFDQHPAEVFEMVEERFYGATFLLWLVVST